MKGWSQGRGWGWAVVALVAALGPACQVVHGSGEYGLEEREVGLFDEVEVSGAMRFAAQIERKVGPGDAVTVRVHGDDNLLKYVELRHDGDRLIVDEADEVFLVPELPLTVEVVLPALRAVDTSGDVSLQVVGLDGGELDVNTSGDSRVHLEGRLDRLRLDSAGDTDIRARGVEARAVEVDVAGDAEVRVCALEEARVDVAGCGEVFLYCGAPELRKNVSGDGRVVRR